MVGGDGGERDVTPQIFVRGVRTHLDSMNSLSLQILKPLSNSLNLISLCLISRYFPSQAIFALLYFTYRANTELE